MSSKQRLLLLISLALLSSAFFLPIWRIDIWAPQYPEGLSMQIGLDHMTGNIDQVNILNHYVGMKHIVPAEIPELRLVPRLFLALLVLGGIGVWVNRRSALRVWFAALALGSMAGIADLYVWGYDYGHDLSPDAPIKIPGMSFQPPLLGHKTILNIDSYSLPDTGGYVIALGMLLAFLILYGDALTTRTRLFVERIRR